MTDEHQWPADLGPDARCEKCGLRYADWTPDEECER